MAIGRTSPSVTTSSTKPGAEMQRQPGLTRLQIWLTSHLALSLALSLCCLTGGLWLARSTVVEQDIGAMLPEGPGSPREAAKLLEEFGALNVLLLDLEIPGASPAELARAGEALATRLRSSGAFSEIVAGQTTEEMMKVGRVLFPVGSICSRTRAPRSRTACLPPGSPGCWPPSRPSSPLHRRWS
jgi:predicted exporter